MPPSPPPSQRYPAIHLSRYALWSTLPSAPVVVQWCSVEPCEALIWIRDGWIVFKSTIPKQYCPSNLTRIH